MNRVVDTHIETAQPVASRAITQRYQMELSPATVRNEMGVLEDKGYLAHTHTSSGRVPTDSGYRYYVDHFVRYETFPEEFFRRLEASLYETSEGIETFVEKALRMLSSFVDEPSLVLLPDPPSADLARAKRVRFMLQGSNLILEKPEFQNIEKIRELFKIFEEKMSLIEWLGRQGRSGGIVIQIGEENQHPGLHDCALVLTSCHMGGREMGAIAILGSRRMRYARAVPLIDYMAHMIGEAVPRLDLA